MFENIECLSSIVFTEKSTKLHDFVTILILSVLVSSVFLLALDWKIFCVIFCIGKFKKFA